jgi:hypothetical protein
MSKLIALGFSLITITAIPVMAEVSPEIHKLCIEAKDYAGCVKAMRGEDSTDTTINQIQRQGANLTEGNNCPAQHVSSGGGYCQRVTCIKRGIYGKGHEQGLGGKGLNCKGGAELNWDNNHQPVRAALDKKCPPGDLDIGFMNTCHQAQVRGYYEGYSMGFSSHRLGVPPTPMTLTNKVTEVFGSPAEKKLQVGDKIITINGIEYINFKKNLLTPGTFKVLIERKGEQIEFTLTSELQTVTIPKAKNL